MKRAGIGEHAFPGAMPFLVLPQIGLRLSRGFLDRSGMMVLVPGQSGTAREGFLTVCVGALVGSLPGMDTAVSGQ